MKYFEFVDSGTAFYKAFGYECIVNLNDTYIEMMFDSDDKRSNRRGNLCSQARFIRVCACDLGCCMR